MTEGIQFPDVLALAKTAAKWPRAGMRADAIRELTIPICLSSIGVAPRAWAHLTTHYVDAPRRIIEVPAMVPDKVWTARKIQVPKPLWAVMMAAAPWLSGDDNHIYLVSPFVAWAYKDNSRPNDRRAVLRNLKEVARMAGVDAPVSWQSMRSSFRRSLVQQGLTPEQVALQMGVKPKTRRARHKSSRIPKR